MFEEEVRIRKKNWNQYLTATAFAYRSIKQETTGQLPFYLLYGYEPQTYFDNTLRPIDIKEPSFELQLRIRTTIQIQHLNNVREEALKKIKNPKKCKSDVWKSKCITQRKNGSLPSILETLSNYIETICQHLGRQKYPFGGMETTTVYKRSIVKALT